MDQVVIVIACLDTQQTDQWTQETEPTHRMITYDEEIILKGILMFHHGKYLFLQILVRDSDRVHMDIMYQVYESGVRSYIIEQ
jgi:hypothetical protein